MRRVLHILTQPKDALAADMIERQRSLTGQQMEIADLTGAAPDYRALLVKIFEAETIHVW